METELIYSVVGNYSTSQAEPDDQCKICNDVHFGEVLVQRLHDKDWICVKCLLDEHELTQPINIVFDGPPNNDSPCFVEVETDDGKGINAGEWLQKGNYWKLRITKLPQEIK